MQYDHTQRAPLHLLLYATAAAMGVAAWFFRGEAFTLSVIVLVAAMLALAAASFGWLRVQDEGDHLSIRYGPLPIFRKRIAYSDITAVQRDRSTLIDGWGIHYVPLRGWTYNLWGFDCVRLTVAGKTLRIGSDDVERLVEFVRSKVSA